MRVLTEQEMFWMENFGDEYIERNPVTLAARREKGLWTQILSRIEETPRSVLEFGCNIGINLVALARLLPKARLCGLEINNQAAKQAERNLAFLEREREREREREIDILRQSLFDSEESGYDFVFTCGVLIHLNPDMLPLAYQKIYNASSRYIYLAEYYNPTPVSIPYRGHEERLYKRDFAGEFLDAFTDVRLIDYGFIWRRDPLYPEDDTTWFLMEKRS